MNALSSVHTVQSTSAPLRVTPPYSFDQGPQRTVWLGRSSAPLANDIANRLRGLDIELRIWDDLDSQNRRAPPPMRRSTPSSGGLSPGALRRVRDHIEMLLSDRIEVSDLASLVGLSECHFSRSFRRSMGVPPHRYIVGRRIEVAASLMERTGRSLTNIALAVGFADQSHFTRSFTRAKGVAPGAYRRHLTGSNIPCNQE